MPDLEPAQEIQDLVGSTVQYNANASTVHAAVPSSANKVISEFTIYSPQTNAKSDILYVSFDGGTIFKQITWNSSFTWSVKGKLKQLRVKSNGVSVAYEITINYEEY